MKENKIIKKKTIPVTINFSRAIKNQLGTMDFDENNSIIKDLVTNFHFEPAFEILEWEEDKKGRKIIKKAELLEISLVPNRK